MAWCFADELKRYGPSSGTRCDLTQARAYCAYVAATHYENFQVITWLTPRELRPAFAAVYAFCRWSDDLGDEIGDRDESRRLLAWWREELHAMREGRSRHPVYLALREVVATYAIPDQPFEDLISAFEQDQEITRYATYEQLLDYCTRSADPVGRLVLYLSRAHTPENARLADHTCTALQLANFWQDVDRDFRMGRVYLPAEDRERFGVDDESLRERRFTPQFAALLRYEVERTRALFERGRPLVDRVPRRLAVDIDLFSRGGLAILDRIEAQGFDVLRQRPEVSKRAKLVLFGRAVAGRLRLWTPRASLDARGREAGVEADRLPRVEPVPAAGRSTRSADG